MIPPMVDIASDCDHLCPEARFINYSNPMPMVVRALWRKTNVRALGLCMGTEESVHYLADFAGVPRNTASARWVGLNHLTWITDFRTEGKDAWPLVRAKLAERRRNGIDTRSWGAQSGPERKPNMLTHPFSWELFEEYGAFPAPMDRHVTEYFPHRFPGGKYYGSILGVDAYSFERTIARGDRIYDETISLAKEAGPVDEKRLKGTSGEHMQTMDILANFYYDRRHEYAINVPNRGAVSNLPADAILEIPGVTTQEGMAPLPVGEIPGGLAAILLHRTAVVEAAVEAALNGNRKMMVEAMLLDGAVSDYSTAEKLTDALLKAQAEHLPQF
jgi:alpha-galactosidase